MPYSSFALSKSAWALLNILLLMALVLLTVPSSNPLLKPVQEADKQPDFFVYPGEPHNMRGHQSVHLHERITQYFEENLK